MMKIQNHSLVFSLSFAMCFWNSITMLVGDLSDLRHIYASLCSSTVGDSEMDWTLDWKMTTQKVRGGLYNLCSLQRKQRR